MEAVLTQHISEIKIGNKHAYTIIHTREISFFKNNLYKILKMEILSLGGN